MHHSQQFSHHEGNWVEFDRQPQSQLQIAYLPKGETVVREMILPDLPVVLPLHPALVRVLFVPSLGPLA
jgi:hypothetical protein